MADVMARSGVITSCGRRFTVCSHRGGGDGKPFVPGSLRFSSGSDFLGSSLAEKMSSAKSPPLKSSLQPVAAPSQTQRTLGFVKAMKWWEKGIQPNMKEIESAEDLVESLTGAGDKLVIVDFFSPGCAGCRALHPKICQFAETNPDVLFLQINYEKHKSMCYSLNVHVLPFFRFYRGAQGRLCSFSCTNATIKKFKDAMAKHGTERCSLGPAKGLEESELLALGANKDLAFTYEGGSADKPETITEPSKELTPPAPKPSIAVTAWR
ncbi:thioredoxin-like 1-2, chloroplastic isoform X2 [Wolffia australiana]